MCFDTLWIPAFAIVSKPIFFSIQGFRQFKFIVAFPLVDPCIRRDDNLGCLNIHKVIRVLDPPLETCGDDKKRLGGDDKLDDRAG